MEGKDWKIVRVEMLTLPDELGKLRKYYRIYFVWNNKVEDYVDVTEEEYKNKKHFERIEEICKIHRETFGVKEE